MGDTLQTSIEETSKRISNPWPFRLWVTAVVVLTLTVTVIVTAWATRVALLHGSHLTQAQADAVLSVATFPHQVKVALKQVIKSQGDDPYPLLLDRKTTEKSHWQRSFPSASDTGYLLFSGVDPEVKRSIVSLIQIANGRVIARWVPDWKDIIRQITSTKYLEYITKQNMEALHPMLLSDSDVVFNTDGAMVRMDICSHKPVWVLNEDVHHSIEIDNDGNIWSPSISTDVFSDNLWLRDRIEDHALTKISPEGRVLEKHSFTKIMLENDLHALLLGMGSLEDDPIHLNQITVAYTTTNYWQRGDLLISSRHLSTVFLYRPSTGRIVWHKTGPWLGQHSVAFVGDHQISVFNNNIITDPGSHEKHPFLTPGDNNRVMVYDFITKQVSEPYVKLLTETKPVSISGGRAQLLSDGGLFIEETDSGRHLRFTKDRLLWSRVNDYDDERIGLVSWSRYLTAEEVALPLRAIANKKCS